MLRRIAIVSLLLVGAQAATSFAWNALGHKVIAEIAWRQLTAGQRQTIVDTLRRHPRFDADFARRMPDDVLRADKATQDRWIFQAAAFWPEVARDTEYDRPKWHYVNFPLFVDPSDRETLVGKLTANVSAEYPNNLSKMEYNVLQAIKCCQSVLASPTRPEYKAFAYCWLFHLVGDLHQPLHAVTLCSVNRFPDGDRGGYEIPLRRGRNLHALWDGLLGSGDSLREVNAEVAQSGNYRYLVDYPANETDPRKWADESRALAESFAYSNTILDAVRNTATVAELAPIELSESYMQLAGQLARRRIAVAGLRLGVLLKDTPASARADTPATNQLPETTASNLHAPTQPAPAETPLYWLNTSSGVRHNKTCVWFGKTKRGRPCTANEGRPCGECGG